MKNTLNKQNYVSILCQLVALKSRTQLLTQSFDQYEHPIIDLYSMGDPTYTSHMKVDATYPPWTVNPWDG